MPHAFKRLRLLGRRPPEQEDQSPPVGRAVDIDAMPLAGATSASSPLLLPAAIYQQVLYDPAESSPVWARPRPVPAPISASSTDEPKPPKRTRRPKANATSGAKSTRAKRIAKPDRDASHS